MREVDFLLRDTLTRNSLPLGRPEVRLSRLTGVEPDVVASGVGR